MSNVEESKEITLHEFNNADTETLAELVHELLLENGIEAGSFSFAIEVSYWEV